MNDQARIVSKPKQSQRNVNANQILDLINYTIYIQTAHVQNDTRHISIPRSQEHHYITPLHKHIAVEFDPDSIISETKF